MITGAMDRDDDERSRTEQLRDETIETLQRLLVVWTQERDAMNERIDRITKQLSDFEKRRHD